MRSWLVFLIGALFLVACAAPVQTTTSDPSQVSNQPHLPPPDFPTTPVTTGERVCSGMVAGGLATCAATEFCYIPTGQYCGAADYPGVCRDKPEMCTLDYNPVCGCDGETYSNECAAHAAGVSVAETGVCK